MSQWLDCPLEDEQDDQLGRAHFAKLVAAALLAENRQRATVIGLTGGWGTGKSTVANFAINRARAANQEVKVIFFEPWMVGTSEALAHEFFKELGKAVLPKGDSREEKDRRAVFYRYSALALDALALSTDAGSILGVPFAGLATKGLRGSKKAIDIAAKAMEAQSQLPTLREARQSLSEALAELKTPVIVVIDDIDRLNAQEVRTVFQLIKACADFPNVRYLLLYDREQVTHALEGSVKDPQAFIQKIVNQVFDLPESTRKQRTALLEAAISELGLHSDLPKDDMDRLSVLFDQLLLPGLTSVRHVKRYLSTVHSLLPGVVVDGFRNIDPSDFLALEYIRQFAPSLYSVLRDESAPNPGGRVELMVHSSELPAIIKKRRQEAADQLNEPIKALAKIALKALFESGMSESAAHAGRRFNTDYWRPVYFGFSEARATISESEWIGFLELLKTSSSLDSWLELWLDRELRDRWVLALCRRANEINESLRSKLMASLFCWGDRQSYERTNWFSEEGHAWHLAVSFCCTALLEAIQSQKLKKEILEKAIADSGALVSPCLVVGMEASRQRKDSWGHWAHGLDLTSFISSLEPRLTGEIESDRFWDFPDPDQALNAWHYVAQEKCSAWYDSLPTDSARLVNHLNFCLGSKVVAGDLVDWASTPESLEATKSIDINLLTESGKLARQHVIDSAIRIKNRDRLGFQSQEDQDSQNLSEEDCNGEVEAIQSTNEQLE